MSGQGFGGMTIRAPSTGGSLGPNAGLVGQPGSRALLETPALVLDRDAFDRNLAAMAHHCARHAVQLRPHAKTHKSIAIARLQLAAGAVGVCVATLCEAEVMASGGIAGLHLTTPVIGAAKIERLTRLLNTDGDLSVVVDNPDSLGGLEQAARRSGRRLKVLVDVDLGSMFRTGVANEDAALALAQSLARSSCLRFGGVQFYSGLVQHIPDRAERAGFYGQHLERLAGLLDRLNAAGLAPEIVTGGGTGTFSIDLQSRLFTEVQPGSYVFLDMEYDEVDLLGEEVRSFSTALFVQSTVVSNNAAGLVAIDAGSKCFASDGPVPKLVSGAPATAAYQDFGDEFGMVMFEDVAQRLAAMRSAGPRDAKPHELFYEVFGSGIGRPAMLPVGAKVELVVPHCDPTVNLHEYYHCVRGDTLVDVWPIDARGPL